MVRMENNELMMIPLHDEYGLRLRYLRAMNKTLHTILPIVKLCL